MSVIDENNAHIHQAGFVNFGGFYIRQFVMTKGEIHKGHSHNIDHLGNLVRGKVRVRWRLPDSSDEGVVDVLVPAKLSIRARYWHEIEALEDSLWECWFAAAEADRMVGDRNLVDWTG